MDLGGKTAFITGGASGIGSAMAQVFLEAGANVVIADVEREPLLRKTDDLRALGKVEGIVLDVADPGAVERAAKQTIETFGKVHILCNNAGVGRAGPIESISLEEWRWVLDVNLMGAVHGLRSFLPHMKAHGEKGHVVNTSSLAGLRPTRNSGPYCAAKYGLIGISEVLRLELEGTLLGVSVLCPFFVRTNMVNSGRNRPAKAGGPLDPSRDAGNAARLEYYKTMSTQGADAYVVAKRVKRAIELNDFFIFTHADRRPEVEDRYHSVFSAFDAAEAFDREMTST